jgi:hypothetical protein
VHLERYTDVNSGALDLALRLKPLAGKGYTLVSTEAGTLPLYSTWRSIDPLGLNDEYLAHHDGVLTDVYLDRYRPEYWGRCRRRRRARRHLRRPTSGRGFLWL